MCESVERITCLEAIDRYSSIELCNNLFVWHGIGFRCVRPKGHDGPHTNREGKQWW